MASGDIGSQTGSFLQQSSSGEDDPPVRQALTEDMSPMAMDVTLGGVIRDNVIITLSSVDIAAEFGTDADSDLSAASLAFDSVTANGIQVVSLADIGFSYQPDVGDAGTLIVNTNSAPFIDALDDGGIVQLAIGFTLSDGTHSDQGVLNLSVTGSAGEIDFSAAYQGANTIGQILTADVTTGIGEAETRLVFTGPNTLKDVVGTIDFGLGGIDDFNAALPGDSLTFAYASSINSSAARAEVETLRETFDDLAGAVAIAQNEALASAASDNLGLASAFAESGGEAVASSTDESFVAVLASSDAAATGIATGDSVVTLTARDEGSRALAVAHDEGTATDIEALGGSTVTVLAVADSTVTGFAESGSWAIAATGSDSSAAAEAVSGSFSNATGTGGSTATALALDDSLADAFASGESSSEAIGNELSRASALANENSNALAGAATSSFAQARSTVEAGASALALGGSVATADAEEGSSALSLAEEDSNVTSNTDTDSVAVALATDSGSASAESSDGAAARADASAGAGEATAEQNAGAYGVSFSGSDAIAAAEEGARSTALASRSSSATAVAQNLSAARAVASSIDTGAMPLPSTLESDVARSLIDEITALAEEGTTALAAFVPELIETTVPFEFDFITASLLEEPANPGMDGISDAGALAVDSSMSNASATDVSSATATATALSSASAIASDNSVSVATSAQTSTAYADSSDNSAGNANAFQTSDAAAQASDGSAATADATSLSSADAIATASSAADSTASDEAEATAMATNEAVATATSLSFTGDEDVARTLPFTLTTTPAGAAANTVTISGLLPGSLLSAGVPSGDGSVWTIDGPLPSGLTLTPPPDFNGEFQVQAESSRGADLLATGSAIFRVTPVNDLPEGEVTVSGTARQGETLVASSSVTDVDGLGTLVFQWFADDEPIQGATSTTYEVTAAEVGKTLTVQVAYTDDDGTVETVTSDPTDPVLAPQGLILNTPQALMSPNAPVAMDLDLGNGVDDGLQDNVVFTIAATDLVAEFGSDPDSDLDSMSLSFGSVTANGSLALTLADVGFSYTAGPNKSGSITIDTNIAPFVDALLDNETAEIAVTFTLSDGVQSDQGVLTFDVTGEDGDFDVSITYLGQNLIGQVLEAQASAAADEALAVVVFSGPTTIRDLAGDLGLDSDDDALADFVMVDNLTAAAAYAENASSASATVTTVLESFEGFRGGTAAARDHAEAVVRADNSSSANAAAEIFATAVAEATDNSSADALATGDIDSESTASAGSYASDDSSAVTVASDEGSQALAIARDNGDSTATASGDSRAAATAVEEGSATASAESSSTATATAAASSTATASAEESSWAIANAGDSSVASAEAAGDSVANALASINSASSANAEDGSDALSNAGNSSAGDATATERSSAIASASNSSVATATGDKDSTATAAAADTSSATAFAADSSLSRSEAMDSSITNGVAITDSGAQASAIGSSDTLALALNGSRALASSDANSSASSAALSEATAVSTGSASATGLALAEDGASSTGTATGSSVAAALSKGEGTAEATADDGSAASAVTDSGTVTSDAADASAASAAALSDGTASATATDTAQGTAFASDGSMATATASANAAARAFAGAGSDPGDYPLPDNLLEEFTTTLNSEITALVTTGKAIAADVAMNAITNHIQSLQLPGAQQSDPQPQAFNTNLPTSINLITTSLPDAPPADPDAVGGSTAEAQAADSSLVNASAADGGSALVNGQSFGGDEDADREIPLDLSAMDLESSIQTLTISGLPAGSLLSAGTSNVDGTQWTINGPLPEGLTVTPPLNLNGDIPLLFETRVAGELMGSATATYRIAPVNDAPVGDVIIAGQAREGETLTASQNLADVDGVGVITFQWLAAGEPIEGATLMTYVPTVSDAGKQLTVRASYTDLDGTDESVTSDPTAPIEVLGLLVEGGEDHDSLTGGLGDDTLTGFGGNDTLVGLAGDDLIDGGDGIDVAVFANSILDYSILNSEGDLQVSGPSADTADALTAVERLQFSDLSLAFDLNGNAGTIAKLLGVVLGADDWYNREFVGIGLDILDNSDIPLDALMSVAFEVVLGPSPDNLEVINLIYQNLIGIPAPAQDAAALSADLLDSGAFTQGELGVIALDVDLNLINIDFVGLVNSGVEFVPLG